MTGVEAPPPDRRPPGSLRFALACILATVVVLAGAAALGTMLLLAVLRFVAVHL